MRSECYVISLRFKEEATFHRMLGALANMVVRHSLHHSSVTEAAACSVASWQIKVRAVPVWLLRLSISRHHSSTLFSRLDQARRQVVPSAKRRVSMPITNPVQH